MWLGTKRASERIDVGFDKPPSGTIFSSHSGPTCPQCGEMVEATASSVAEGLEAALADIPDVTSPVRGESDREARTRVAQTLGTLQARVQTAITHLRHLHVYGGHCHG